MCIEGVHQEIQMISSGCTAENPLQVVVAQDPRQE